MNDILKDKKVAAISLGCDKNRVDLEFMLGSIKEHGFEVIEDVAKANIVIVNTCAFIQPATKEAIDSILFALDLKRKNCEKVIVTGCINERYQDEMAQNFADVDLFVRVKNNCNIVNEIYKLYGIENTERVSFDKRLLSTTPHYAFLKIADGCNNGCAYCTIPRIRGRYKSVEQKELVKQAKILAEQGVKELILVAQDVTRYGEDLYGEFRLISLLEDLCKIKDIVWIRLHYIYPELIDKTLLDYIYSNNKICNYLDIPLQHIDNEILFNMNRRLDEQKTRELITLIKTDYPKIAIRSTFIIGFPGEKKKHFDNLLNFLEEYKLNNVGFFGFCREEKTKAYFMKGQVSNFIKNRRLNKVKALQQKTMDTLNMGKIGNVVNVLVDDFDMATGNFVGRDEFNSISVDFIYEIVDNGNIHIGNFYNVKITGYENGVFKGEIV